MNRTARYHLPINSSREMDELSYASSFAAISAERHDNAPKLYKFGREEHFLSSVQISGLPQWNGQEISTICCEAARLLPSASFFAFQQRRSAKVSRIPAVDSWISAQIDGLHQRLAGMISSFCYEEVHV